MKTLVVIPALNPPTELIDYVQKLKNSGLEDILVVDDGSRKEFHYLFEQLKTDYHCQVLTHAKNLGKGRALKNAFNYFLTMPNVAQFNGVVTADSDGQHRVEDVLAMVETIENSPNSLILGCRDFDSENVPPKSKFGNKLTKFVFKLLYGRKITDTQTGLRGFPKNILKEMLEIPGERFEYETKMLIHAFDRVIPIQEITIETIYFDGNAETHFNPIKDSLKIYKVIFASFLKYLASSLSSFIVDIGLFQLFLWGAVVFGAHRGATLILLATIFARIFSSYFNFTINKNIVFNGEKRIHKTIVKYYSLAAFQMLASATLVTVIWNMFSGSETVIKIIVDMILFLVSYQIQRRWVFR
ncbi:bifunctional glycosyltransferase family 2/GtrA family protein [Streptococcus oralis]|uniref:Glycosyltransferase involved in cell wall biogenesis n=1 Tax=Streptococcus oralis TaxID=1303 RepID=A0A139PEZ7_STROR|nr:bifunctional glycosyltransferase family 2/GtrA family protein [Streptococcus oralis]KXT87723.1 Glycosyltransferase involved in cell wall biogenesis [Streptococcus oralis]